MKVLLVNGSSRKNGCTNAALAEVARALHEEGVGTEAFFIGNEALPDCTGCRRCRETGRCVFDDAVNRDGGQARHADALSSARRSISPIPAPACWPLWTGHSIRAAMRLPTNPPRRC